MFWEQLYNSGAARGRAETSKEAGLKMAAHEREHDDSDEPSPKRPVKAAPARSDPRSEALALLIRAREVLETCREHHDLGAASMHLDACLAVLQPHCAPGTSAAPVASMTHTSSHDESTQTQSGLSTQQTAWTQASPPSREASSQVAKPPSVNTASQACAPISTATTQVGSIALTTRGLENRAS